MKNLTGLTDAALIDYYYNHHPQALEEIFIRYKDELFRFCLSATGERPAAIDLLIAVYQRVWQKKYNRLFAIPFKTWIFTQAAAIIISKESPASSPQLISRLVNILAAELHFGAQQIATIVGQRELIIKNLIGSSGTEQRSSIEAIDQLSIEEEKQIRQSFPRLSLVSYAYRMLAQRLVLLLLGVVGIILYAIYLPKIMAVNQSANAPSVPTKKVIIQPLDFEPKGKVLSQKGIYEAVDEPSHIQVKDVKSNASQLDRQVEEVIAKIKNNRLLGDDRYENLFKYPLDNRLPPKDAVNINKMVNYFSYASPLMAQGKAVGLTVEVMPTPWSANTLLSFTRLQVAPDAVKEYPNSHIIFLIDASGSMLASGKLTRIKNALHTLVAAMNTGEQIAIVTYGHAGSGLVLGLTPNTSTDVINEAIDHLDINAKRQDIGGLRLAYDLFNRQDLPNSNRLVMVMTDINNDLCTCSNEEINQLIKDQFAKGITTFFIGLRDADIPDIRRDEMALLSGSTVSYVAFNQDLFKAINNKWRGPKPLLPKSLKMEVIYHPSYVGTSWSWVNEPAIRIDEFQLNGELNEEDELFTVKVDNDIQLIKRRDVVAKGSDDFRFAASLVAFGAITRDDNHKGNANLAQVIELSASALGNPPDQKRKDFLRLVSDIKRLADAKSHP